MSVLEKVKARIFEDADCWRWSGACCNGHPCMRVGGKTALVRRALFTELTGAIPAGKILRQTCETRDCVNPEHAKLTSYQKLAKECGAIGLMGGHIRNAKIAAAKQVQSKLTREMVDEIRTTSESGVSISKRLGLSENLVSKVRLFKTWRISAGNPWGGLL